MLNKTILIVALVLSATAQADPGGPVWRAAGLETEWLQPLAEQPNPKRDSA